MKLHWIILTAALAAAACGQAFAGTEFYDRENAFKVTIPDGWRRLPPEQVVRVDAVFQSPRYETTRGACAFAADPFPPTRGMSQQQINDEMGPQINADFWRSALTGGAASDRVHVDDATSELRNGKRVYRATIRILGHVDGADQWAKLRATLHLAPDQIAMASCASWLDHAAAEEADIGIVVSSFEALGAQVVAQRPAPAVANAALLLFAGPRFDGARRTLTEDVPNLVQTGWRVPTGSFALQGLGLWQVCDGANYAGNCLVLAGAASASGSKAYRPLRIGSARRIAAPNDARAVIGVLATGVAAHTSATMERLSKRR